ncbi:hypothetical protein V7x_00610 [Crateriforma conspicua]|uniref:Uncharacterized protein n=1 Tax=Crateriforma conspicua TaxID=2527996 RepID=A0A5C6FN31_9PLAN|nr:hypothetical protein V7x_00610 [Crateriforma conspicua]
MWFLDRHLLEHWRAPESWWNDPIGALYCTVVYTIQIVVSFVLGYIVVLILTLGLMIGLGLLPTSFNPFDLSFATGNALVETGVWKSLSGHFGFLILVHVGAFSYQFYYPVHRYLVGYWYKLAGPSCVTVYPDCWPPLNGNYVDLASMEMAGRQ